jgi:hypothetical protein
MEQKSSVPPIPALPVTEAHALEVIERKLSSALENCMDSYGAIANELKTDTYMRSYVVKIFSLYLSAYSKHLTVLKHWIPELKLNSIQWAMGCLLDFSGVTEKESKRYEKLLITTLNEYVESAFGDSPNPLLAALAEPQPAKLASASAASGIDIASASPLMIMALAEASRRSEQHPQARPATPASSESIGDQIKRYMREARLTKDKVASALSINPRSVARHRSGAAIPRPDQVSGYEALFSKRLNRPIRLETP